MTYREFNELWKKDRKTRNLITDQIYGYDHEQNCPYVENLIYRPATILEHCAGTMDIHPEITRSWGDEISEIDKQYLLKKCRPKFIATLCW